MAFHDVRLPEDVERGAQGGPRFKTTVLELTSGYEKRNIDWSSTRGEWNIAYGLDSKANLESVLAFFYARYGRAHTFRFKDWTDYRVGASGAPQQIGTGDGSKRKFQIYRLYSSGGYTYSRNITRPVSGTCAVYKAGVLQTTGVSVDYSSGIVAFTVAPTTGQAVAVYCEFDVPVRFDVDKLPLRADGWDGDYAVPDITVVEVRETLGSLA